MQLDGVYLWLSDQLDGVYLCGTSLVVFGLPQQDHSGSFVGKNENFCIFFLFIVFNLIFLLFSSWLSISVGKNGCGTPVDAFYSSSHSLHGSLACVQLVMLSLSAWQLALTMRRRRRVLSGFFCSPQGLARLCGWKKTARLQIMRFSSCYGVADTDSLKMRRETMLILFMLLCWVLHMAVPGIPSALEVIMSSIFEMGARFSKFSSSTPHRTRAPPTWHLAVFDIPLSISSTALFLKVYSWSLPSFKVILLPMV